MRERVVINVKIWMFKYDFYFNNSSQIVKSSIEKNNVTVPLERTIKLDHIAPCIKF